VEHTALFCREGEYGREVGNVLSNILPYSSGKEIIFSRPKDGSREFPVILITFTSLR
jgi:hypothetical protein